MFKTQPFFAAIAGMALQGKLSIAKPAVQGFDINAEVMSSLGYRHKGHGITPFGCNAKQEQQTNLLTCREKSGELRRQKARDDEEEHSAEKSGEFSQELRRQKARDDEEEHSAEKSGPAQAASSDRTGFFTAATMIVASPILVGAPKP